MAAMKPPKGARKQQPQEQQRDDRMLSFYAQVLDFYERRKPVVYGGLAVIVLLLLGGLGYFYLQVQRGAEADGHLSQIVMQYEQGNYDVALEGTEDALGLVEIADAYGGTDAGNVAAFYAANAYFEQGQMEEALAHYEKVEERSTLVGASAVAGRAAVHEEQGDFARAGELYRRAASLYDTGVTSPQHLLSAARAFEADGNDEQALAAYQDLQDQYPETRAARDVALHIARVEARLAQASS